MAGITKESRVRAHPLINGRIVVGITVAVDVAHAGRGATRNGTQPPIDALSKMRRTVILPLTNQLHTLSSALYKLYRRFNIFCYLLAPARLHNPKIYKALKVLDYLLAVGNGKRHVMPPLADVVFGVGVKGVSGYKVVHDASRGFGHRNGKNESVSLWKRRRSYKRRDLFSDSNGGGEVFVIA